MPEWRREKKSLILWLSRLMEPLDVRREIRPSVRDSIGSVDSCYDGLIWEGGTRKTDR